MSHLFDAGNHTTLTSLSSKLTKKLRKVSCVDRISPGRISSERARSRQVKIRKEGPFSLTIIVVGGGIQQLFVICDKKSKDSVEKTVIVTKRWANKNHIPFHYKDITSATV